MRADSSFTPRVIKHPRLHRARAAATHFAKDFVMPTLRTIGSFIWTWGGKALRGIGRLIFWLVVTTVIAPWKKQIDGRRSWLYGAVWGAIIFLTIGAGFQLWPNGEQSASLVEIIEETADKVMAPTSTTGACGAKCQETIRTSRSHLRGIEENEVRYVLVQYNTYVASSGWRTKAQNCYAQHWEAFATAQRYTLYPAELIAGKALIEGDGCRFVNSYNGDGGKGPMQITHPDSSHIRATGQMLGTTKEGVRWQSDYLHNVLLGTVMLSDFENMFGSRGVGILAYNRGPGNVRRDMRRGNLDSTKHRVISDFRGSIPERAGIGGKPRVYVDKILAGAVIMSRVAHGKPLVALDSLSLSDIPGADPSQDHL